MRQTIRSSSAAALVAAAVLAVVWMNGGFSSGTGIRGVLFVTLDTTRADRLGCYGYEGAETRALDSLAKRGVLFESAYACTPLTLPSHSTLMTGTFPVFHGVRNNGAYALGEAPATLAEVFRRAGWKTAAFVSAFVLDSRYGLARGFETYHDDLLDGHPVQDSVRDVKHRSAMLTAGHAVEWLRKTRKKKFFLWVHFFDPHLPHLTPLEFAARFPGRPYDAEVAYMDSALGYILDEMREWGILDETLVVAVGDHGEGLGDHGEEEHGLFIYNSTMRVPLLFSLPSALPHGMRLSPSVRTADVAPTVAELAGLSAESMQGRSLAAMMKGGEAPLDRPAYLESRIPLEGHNLAPLSGFVLGREKYVRAPREEFYNLAEDPGEARNLWSAENARAVSLKETMASVMKALLPADGRPAFARRGMAREEEAKLKSLGYVFGGSMEEDDDMTRPDPKDALLSKDRYPSELRSDILRLLENGRVPEAGESLRRLLEADPGNAQTHALAGAFHENRGDAWEEAEKSYREALRLDPANADARVGLGSCRMQRGEREAGKEIFREVIRSDPEHLKAHLYLATALMQEEKFDEAMDVLQDAAKLIPYSEQLHNNIGLLHLRRGDREEARERFETALRLKPDYAQARENLARAAAP